MRATRYLLQLAYDIIRGSGEEAMEQMYGAHNDHPLRDFGLPPHEQQQQNGVEFGSGGVLVFFSFRLSYPLTRDRYASTHMSSSSARQKGPSPSSPFAVERARYIFWYARQGQRLRAYFGVETRECV
ncbi:hypothetical protein I7I50_02793 [Histoplasma capsulatum G186AR]|uniref:Uncharacterized protein n=1 Tax=Ajellomyces capsulatus TaxID=5037 RepID=A0A8H7Z2V1_AJECA|nr:hypothetical protein I7I52_00541 [Histoplasma capsulatum]QSS71802.1 hypothetical protein I7I50_02793 [Histoplasma capsulatum G186AR]